MVVSTQTPDVVEARASVFEFLLINHPLDCPVCDKGGECPLQDFSYSFGPNESRMEFPRRVFDGEGVRADVDFGPTLMLNRNRCILCTRCVRFMREVESDAQINIIDRGYGSEIATFQEEGVHSLLSGNLMDVCPVGAITTRDYRFKSRPWDNPDAVDTICTLCEKGCNTTAWLKAKPEWAKGAQLIRMTPRFNPDVNDYWMCDIGRFDYRWIEGDERLQRPLLRTEAGTLEPTDWRNAVTKIVDRVTAAGGPAALRFFVSAHASLEELCAHRPHRRHARRARGRRGHLLAAAREAAAAERQVQDSGRRRAERARSDRPGLPREADARRRRGSLGVRQRRSCGHHPGAVRLRSGTGRIDRATSRGSSRPGARASCSMLIVQGVVLTPLAQAADIVLPGAAWVEKDAILSSTGRGGCRAPRAPSRLRAKRWKTGRSSSTSASPSGRR